MKNIQMDYLEFAGLQFRGLTRAQLYPTLGQFKFVVTVNADFIVESVRNQRFRGIISSTTPHLMVKFPFCSPNSWRAQGGHTLRRLAGPISPMN